MFYAEYFYADCCYGEFFMLSVVMGSVVVLNVVMPSIGSDISIKRLKRKT